MTTLQKGFLQAITDTPPPCTQEDPEIFFTGPDTRLNDYHVRLAKAVCHNCPLKFACLQFALETNDGYAIMGGLTPDERSNRQLRYNIYREKQAA